MNGREETHGKAFFAWRDKVLNAWRREADRRQKAATIEAAGGEAALMRQKVEQAKADHEKAKAGNKVIAQATKDGKDISEYLMTEFGIKPHMLDWAMRFGVLSSNSLPNIRRMEERVKELEAKEQRREQGQTSEITGNGWKFVQNNEADRYQFIFDGKPDESTRNLMKRNGFKWAPSQSAWQRQITANALYATQSLIKQLQQLQAA